MKVEQRTWSERDGWNESLPSEASFVLTVASGAAVHETSWRQELADRLGQVPALGCSTAGDICDVSLSDGGVVACVVSLERSSARLAQAPITEDGAEAGRRLASALAAPDLRHVLVLADGLNTNGSALATALQADLPSGVTISGGLAGDQERFEQTYIWTHGLPRANAVAALGLYGESLRVGFGSQGGWRPFGPERRVTKSEGNRLHRLEDSSALALYHAYLGELADDLPASGLRFPLSLRLPNGDDRRVVRTLLSIDSDGAMVFAGDIPEGSFARLMHTGNEGLITGAERAAEECVEHEANPELAILVSCVGRRLVLGQACEDELEAVAQVLGTEGAQFGFYSYGELSPRKPDLRCDLHNQTMTITTLSELV